MKKKKIILSDFHQGKKMVRDSQLSGFWMYLSYQLGVRSNSYLTTDALLRIYMEDFCFHLAFYSLLLGAGCQASELVYAVTCFPVFMQ